MANDPTDEIHNDATRAFSASDANSKSDSFDVVAGGSSGSKSEAASSSSENILDQLAEDFTRRLRDGEHPAIEEYQNRYPDLSDEIEELLSSVAMIEQLKSDTNRQDRRSDAMATLGNLEQIDGYRIVRELGRGGMGVVFEAVHETLGRRVAIKVMPTPLVDGDKHVARFRQEARSAAKLHHTNIVGVFGVGESEGIYYYVMDFVDGQALSDVISSFRLAPSANTGKVVGETMIDGGQNPMPQTTDLTTEAAKAPVRSNLTEAGATASTIAPDGLTLGTGASSGSHTQPILIKPAANTPQYFRWVAKIAANAADALAYAHTSKILHRDIKPSNMVLDKKGVIWITDFGLAKDGTVDADLTATGTVLGTPQYMAPESLEGRYDVRSETYCLGLTLYELATLRPAFASGSPAEVICAVATQTPTAPRKVNSRIPIDLSTIVEKAISREPSQRYLDAASLRNDLMAFVEDRPISARRISMIESVIRLARRNPIIASLLAVSALLLVLVAATASVGYVATTDALRKEAEKSQRLKVQQQETEKARFEAVQNFDQMKLQFDRAEANVATTIRAFDEMFKQVIARGAGGGDVEIDGLREISGIESSVTAEDAAFLDKLVSFYEEFANNNADNERLKSESAKAFRRVGNIYHRVGEMQPAVDAYKKSLGLYQDIFSASPKEKDGLLTIAGIQYELSSASLKNGDAVEAHQWNKKSIQLLEKSPLSDSDPDIRLALARTLSSMGLSVFRIASVGSVGGRSPKLKDSVRQGGRRPGDRAGRNGRGDGKKMDRVPGNGRKPIGDRVSQRFNEFVRAGGGVRGLEQRNRQLVSRAIQITDSLVADDPSNAEYLSVQATCLFMAAAARIREDREAGFELRDRAIDSLDSLVADYPDSAEYRYLLALACSLGDSPQHRDDIKLFSRSIEIVEKLLQQFPTNLDYHHLNANLRAKKARYAMREQKFDSAFADLKLANDSLQVLYDLTPSDRSYQITKNVLVSTLQNISTTFRKLGQLEDSAEAAKLSKDIRDEMRPKRGYWKRKPGIESRP